MRFQTKHNDLLSKPKTIREKYESTNKSLVDTARTSINKKISIDTDRFDNKSYKMVTNKFATRQPKVDVTDDNAKAIQYLMNKKAAVNDYSYVIPGSTLIGKGSSLD